MKQIKSILISCTTLLALFGSSSLLAATCNPSWQGLPFFRADFIKLNSIMECYYASTNNPRAGAAQHFTSFGTISGPWKPYAAGILRCEVPGNPSVCVFK